ncbi:MAG: adenylosuccinate lyase [Flavobacteriaceae bacterium]|nr:adenylosuccinate lyase [Flavobacteriaceae bacterium]|tara:strand:+ start:10159 stop:11502 length:1344 start_codon:yes stop_codon:yes gene_type:complete
MSLTSLNAISPIDGRYRSKIKELSNYFSEKALIYFRIKVEIEYFISLCELPIPQLKNFNHTLFSNLREIYTDFSEKDSILIKEIEKTTNHDVKAVEYFIKKKFEALNISEYKEFIHFGLTSQDINNTAIPLSIKECIKNVYLFEIKKLISKLSSISSKYREIVILARTHGQPASPTRLGKEFDVFIKRLKNQIQSLTKIPYASKFGGATGNFNAHKVAYPKINWKKFGKEFVEQKLGLHYSFPTTQIDHYDSSAELFDSLKRINTIIIDFNQDIWLYISMDYFKQKINDKEIGSSAMPHKINPIDFENSEGNLGLANAIYNFLSKKLPISRLQRDLTDSTLLRNIGVSFGHSLIGIKSTTSGLSKLEINKPKIDNDLENNWVVISEGIQTILRREGYSKPYETLKELTRTNKKINKENIFKFIDNLKISDSIKKELKSITPFNYTGI